MLSNDGEALAALEDIADLIVSHSRTISHACDDSVLRVTGAGPVIIRRGRGHAPNAITLPGSSAPVLATGAHLKNTVCALRGDRAHLSAHIGDLESPGMHGLVEARASELLRWLDMEPVAVACDLHPDYASSRLARRLSDTLGVPLLPVQHHHAHIAAIAAASGVDEPLLGLALDGHGLGSDGGSWGGELLRVEGGEFTRLGHLRSIPLPGGDRATRETWRLALAAAAEVGRPGAVALPEEAGALRAPLLQLLERGSVARTTACGRYFDAAAALLGICTEARFEAEAAMRLESCCRAPRSNPGLYRITASGPDLRPLFDRLLDCAAPEEGGALFHGVLVDALAAWMTQQAEATGLRTVALGGGCFVNGVLGELLPQRLRRAGLRVLAPWQLLPPGDGGISLGQAWVAAQRLARGSATTSETAEGVR